MTGSRTMAFAGLALEILAYAAAYCFLGSGLADGVARTLPSPLLLSMLPAVLAVAAFPFLFINGEKPALTMRATVVMTLLVVAAAVLPDPRPFSGTPWKPVYILYVASVAAAAAAGRARYWIAAALMLAAVSLGGGAVRLHAADAEFTAPAAHGLFSGLAVLVPVTAAMAACGAAVYFVSRNRLRAMQNDWALLLRRTVSQTQATAQRAAGRDSDSLQSAQLSKTQAFTLDFISELRQEGDANVQELLSSVVYFMNRNFKAYSSLGFIYDPAARAFRLNSFQSRSPAIARRCSIGLGAGVVGAIGTEGHSFMSGDVSLYSSKLNYYSSVELIHSILAVPIISEQKELLGALVIDSKDKNSFTDQHKETMKRFSALAAALITNARMRFYQEQTARRFKVFYEASQRFTPALTAQDVFGTLTAVAMQVVPAGRVMVVSFNPSRKTGTIQKIDGQSPELQEGMEFEINSGLYSYAFQKRQVVTIGDYVRQAGNYYRFVPGETINPAIRSLIIVPLLDDEGRCLCLLSLESDKPHLFSNEIETLLSTLTGNASVALSRAILYQRMEMLATTDGLTGLNNHRHFQEILAAEIERSRRYNQPLTLLLMDIDHFKSFNDTYGHPVGDLVLKEISACIRSSIRRTDVPARYGGEEFVVILPVTDQEKATVSAERIRTTIEQHVIVSIERQLHVTVSIGSATYPGQASTQQELIDNADRAMYHSKENGRNRYTQFAPGMGKKEKKK